MAPMKRPRARVEEEDRDDGLLEVESASSRLQPAASKRARVVEASRQSKTPQNADSDDEDMYSTGGQDEEGTQGLHSYEDRRDAGFADLADEDLDTQRATQVIQKRNQRTMENLPAENGVIEAVTCINFMCHRKLHVSFGPLINFIIGHNGSGKSAVLTALTLCLGGKATSTNRGQSLKSFIKEGEESATLIVKLKNGGSNGYQQETYGDSIIVERHFTRAGTSGFKVKNANGRVISTKRVDLEEISDFFALQIDNPMNVLTQDMARQFLNNSTPSDKYKFFVKGVQLEQLDQDYRLLEETIDNIENKLETRTRDIEDLKKQAKEAAEKLALSDRHNSLREKIGSCRRQMAWAQVEEQERGLAQVEEELTGIDPRIAEADEKAAEAGAKFDQATEVSTRAANTVREEQEALAPIHEDRKQVKEQFDKNKSDLINHQSEERSIRDHLKGAQQNVTKKTAEIQAEQDRLAAVDGGANAQKLVQIEDARRESEGVHDRLTEHSEKANELDQKIQQADRYLQSLKPPVEAKSNEVRQCENHLQALHRDKGQQQGAFHENMPRLLRAIQEDRSFREKPVGPVGNHVRLLKPIWSSILERSFGQTLSSFIVTSKHDQGVLSDLMRKVRCPCPILIGNHQTIDTTGKEPDPEFDTSLRVLEIDNDLVKRQLIINQGIEQTILVENREEAGSVMFDGPKPRNVKQCFCLHDSRRGWGLRLGWTRGVEATTSPMPAMTDKPRMKTDIESQISYQQETLRQLQQELSDLEQKVRDQNRECRICQQDKVRHAKQSKDLRLEHQRAEENVARLQDELDQNTVEDGRLEGLKAALKDAEEDVESYSGSFQDSITAKDKLNEISRSLRSRLQELDAEIAEYDAKIKKAQSKQLKAANARQAALQEKNEALQAVEDLQTEKQRIVQKRQICANRVEDFSGQANQVCPRVPVDPGDTLETLEKKYEKFLRDLERYQQQMGDSRVVIAQRAKDTSEAYEAAKHHIDELETLAEELKSALSERLDRWRKFRKYISARARSQFMYLLSERCFRGILKTDHRRRVLDLHVEPDETRSGKGRQTKTLSGGEKSFSTICLLLSLWEAMGSPIRCLDEFDVFMDNVNRDVSLKMMINAARRSVGRQYILITPQSMGNVTLAQDVKIIKLSDPERGGQTTLPFGD